MRHFASVIEEPPMQEARTSSVLDPPVLRLPAQPQLVHIPGARARAMGCWDGGWDGRMVSGMMGW